MKGEKLKTKIFLDSGDPQETKEAIRLLGFLDGQTTNPSYFVKSAHVQNLLKEKGSFSSQELMDLYKLTVKQVSQLIPDGSVSIEVYANANTLAEEMMKQARDMFSWISNAHIKFPITKEGLKAASMAVEEKIRINMTVCFAQEQAAAIYAATKGAKRGDVYVSPFIGRLFDNGIAGIDLIKNILKMYEAGDGHVMVLTASLRHLDQFYAAINLGTDIITSNLKYLKAWYEDGMKIPDADFKYDPQNLKEIPYLEISLDKNYSEYNIKHEMTNAGLEKFYSDWGKLIK